jgi:hypothetical protein
MERFDGNVVGSHEERALQWNALTGTIPSSLGSWTNAISIDFAVNELDGTLPSIVGAWARLEKLFISSILRGTLPASIGNWRLIQTVHMNLNAFKGALPSSIGRWVKVEGFEINTNTSSGTIPVSIIMPAGL